MKMILFESVKHLSSVGPGSDKNNLCEERLQLVLIFYMSYHLSDHFITGRRILRASWAHVSIVLGSILVPFLNCVITAADRIIMLNGESQYLQVEE